MRISCAVHRYAAVLRVRSLGISSAQSHDLITSPAFVVIKAPDKFRDKTTAINQMWQTDFTYIKIIGWGWYYLSTILDDFSRYVVA
jgi:putative transposase